MPQSGHYATKSLNRSGERQGVAGFIGISGRFQRITQDIIELPDLFASQHVDAALLPDLSGIYIDQDELRAWDQQDHWIEKRLRFSVAHEIGHYVLHAKLLKDKFTSIEEFKAWAEDRENYSAAEYQADEFAGRLLVHREILLKEYDFYNNPNRWKRALAAEESNGIWQNLKKRLLFNIMI